MAEIGISLSGGGYRAAMFHLGTLSYLNHLDLRLDENKSNVKHIRFLDLVTAMSTISGGTITGLWYMMYCNKKNSIENEDKGEGQNQKQNENDEDESKMNATDRSFLKLYKILTEKDFPTEILDAFLEKGNNNPSLIQEAVKVYDKLFFHGETFKKIMHDVQETKTMNNPEKHIIDQKPNYIHHFSANGTDFSNGLAYRFQASRKILHPGLGRSYATIGNADNHLPGKIASQIKLSEILAVSSCFPGGFEPMHFPADFEFSTYPENKVFVENTKPYRLMDGGIVDNQGIEPLLLANNHLSYDNPNWDKNPIHKSIDLLIISDVSSPHMKPDKEVGTYFYNDITLNTVNQWLSVVVLLLIIAWIPTCYFASHFALGMLTAFLIMALILRGVTYLINGAIKKKLRKLPISYQWKNIRYLTLGRLKTMIFDRVDSLLDLSQAVFMRPIRRMRYQQVYKDKGWINRRITTNITELSKNGNWKKFANRQNEKPDSPQSEIANIIKPSDEIVRNSDLAVSMGTTLWFTAEDKAKGLPEAIFAAGQYTICMNLLEYILKLEKIDSSNTNETHDLIRKYKSQLLKDWKHFQKNPQFLLNKFIGRKEDKVVS